MPKIGRIDLPASEFPEVERMRARARKRKAVIRLAECSVCVAAFGLLIFLMASIVWLVSVGNGHLADVAERAQLDLPEPYTDFSDAQ